MYSHSQDLKYLVQIMFFTNGMVAWYDWELGWYCTLRENRGRLDVVKTELTHVVDENADRTDSLVQI
jgi:hypothetical protein